MPERGERPTEEGSSPSDGDLTLVEAAILTLWEEIAKLRERVKKLEER